MRRMRSGAVVLGGVGILAATLTACGSDEPDRRCVDKVTQEKLPDYECKDSTGHGHYYYGGSVKNGKVSGGSYDKASVSRGGFGGGHGSSGG
ncbi:hypothetical protein [Streptomyces sp. NBC_01465]|uniref:hypothetical protein n=1 Tax=Streptomyces sp. NBC_01465 TaxID=2903878 RepID=UPI002E2EBC88|nr:hypothetical protein [Streptomyces sp. NBC_01465]